jgi:hypothetical protein
LVGSLGLSCRHLFCLGCYSRPVQNIIFLTADYFNSFVPIAQQAGQAAVLGRLSLSVCLWSHLLRFILGCCAVQQTAMMKFLKLFQMADFKVFLVVVIAGLLVKD